MDKFSKAADQLLTKYQNVMYTENVLIPYQEQSGYYNKVENRRALTPRFREALSLITEMEETVCASMQLA